MGKEKKSVGVSSLQIISLPGVCERKVDDVFPTTLACHYLKQHTPVYPALSSWRS